MPKRKAEQSPSLDDTLDSTAGEGRRWNLRKRRSPQVQSEVAEGDVSQDSSTAMDTSVASEVSPLPPPGPSARKRKAAEPKGPSPKRRARKSTEQKSAGEQLFDIIMGGKSALQMVASDWVDRYQADAEAAMVELIQFFVFCCGCKATITLQMFQMEDSSDVIRVLTENFAEDSGEYPLVAPGPAYKKFKANFVSLFRFQANFVEFIERIVIQCQHSVIYDEYMLDTLLAWMVGFTDSQVRAFRHTCTLACVKLVSALISVANSVNTELDNTQRQIDAEKKRQQAKKGAAGKLEKLLLKKGELQRNVSELEETMKKMFASVFVRRYRDVSSEIRAVCITELGTWMTLYGTMFLADSYFKYLGWTLFDKVAEVRLASVTVLESLYTSEDTIPHLELFTVRFKGRMVAMRLDKDDNVAVHAIHLCGHLLLLDMLEPEECVEVCELTFFENRAISHAAGDFAVKYLFSDDFMAKAKQARIPKGKKKPTDGQIMLRELVRFFIDVKIHDHATYFVDALWDHSNVLRDWDSMVSLLLDDKCGISLIDEEEGVLIEIMACAVCKATGVSPPAGRGRGRVISHKEKKAMEEAKEKLSTTLMVALPELISKYGTESPRAANLANIPQHFELEVYAEHRLQKHLESLLTHLHQLTLKHLDTTVLDECSQTYHYLNDTEFTLHSTAEVAFNQLVDELVQNLKYYISECKDQSMSEESEELSGLNAALKRLAAFYKLLNISKWDFTTELNDLLGSSVTGECSDKVLVSVLACLKVDILWSLQSLDEANPNREEMRKVRQKLLQFVKQAHEIVRFSPSAEGKREAYVALCDLLMAFPRQLQRVGQLAPLVYVPDPALQQSLQEYVLENVLSDEDLDSEPASEEEALAQAESLNDRRVLLAGFLKLAMFGVIDMKLVAPVFAQYITQYHNFGDMIKMALSRCRDANPMAWCRTVTLSLQQLFESHLEDNGGYVDQTAHDWADLKDLAKKFALSFGFDRYDATKVRQPLVGIQREGIQFALSRQSDTEPPSNLEFLLVLAEFSFRLLEVDRTGRKGVLAYLESQLPDGIWEQVDGLSDWEPLRIYRNSLAKESTDSHNLTKGKGKGKQAVKGKGKEPAKDKDGWHPRKVAAPKGSPAVSDVGSEGSPEGVSFDASTSQVSSTSKTKAGHDAST